MERADPLFLLMGLPAIPVVLVLGKMIHWEDYIVRLWQRYYYRGKFPLGINTHLLFFNVTPCIYNILVLILYITVI